jgi:hypothetical protein
MMEFLDPSSPGGDGDFVRSLSDFLARMKGKRIRCPKCAWQPRKEDRWSCGPPCFCLWNTFDTAGRCPRCARVWVETACLACHRWSLHVDWYEDAPAGE